MFRFFPDPIRHLPRAEVSIPGMTAFIQQGENDQVVFMEFSQSVVLPEHSHSAQWGIVVAGAIELAIDGNGRIYRKGDSYFIPDGTIHGGKIDAGTVVIDFFHQKDRYHPLE